jgi:hypothetical protein
MDEVTACGQCPTAHHFGRHRPALLLFGQTSGKDVLLGEHRIGARDRVPARGEPFAVLLAERVHRLTHLIVDGDGGRLARFHDADPIVRVCRRRASPAAGCRSNDRKHEKEA